jgi:hypothetical protein
MPVTAKLSRRFYERFGDDITNELVDWFNAVDSTYRAELRETNELNFGRFMSGVDKRFAEMETRFEKRLAEIEIRFEKRISDLRADILKWMFIYWTGTMVALAGFVFAVLRHR